jgi:TPR repeat protein
MKKIIAVLFLISCSYLLHAQVWVSQGRITFGSTYFEVYQKNASWGMGQQFFGTNFYNGLSYKLHVKGEFYAVLFCGNEAVSKLDFTVEAHTQINKVKPASSGPPDGYLSDATGLLGTADEEECKGNEITVNGRKTHVRIRQLGIRKFMLLAVQPDGSEIPVSSSGVLLQSNQNISKKPAPDPNSYNNNPSQNNATKTYPDNNAQQQQQSQAIREQMLAKLEQSQKNFTNQFDNALEGVTDMIIQGMMRKSLRQDNASRTKRFAELEESVSTKNGLLVDCEHCSGNGYTSCKQCSGTGMVTCSNCFGTGKTFSGDVCVGCKGSGKSYCVYCNATGKYFCTYCSGTGKDFKEEYGSVSYSNTSPAGLNKSADLTGKSGVEMYAEAFELYSEGVNEHNSEAFTKAKILLEEAANNGYSSAMQLLGTFYQNGFGVPRDNSKGTSLYEKAADAGQIDALDFIGMLYEGGLNGYEKNLNKALQYYQKEEDELIKQKQFPGSDGNYSYLSRLAEYYNNDLETVQKKKANVMTSLGVAYFNGEGVSRDYIKAKNWWLKAAALKNMYAENNLGMMYAQGTGVEHNNTEAVKWYRLAAGQGYAEAEQNLGTMYSLGLGVQQNYSEAADWLQKAAVQGHIRAQFLLGIMYEDGKGVPKNRNTAIEWYRKAASENGENARYAKESLKRLGVN